MLTLQPLSKKWNKKYKIMNAVFIILTVAIVIAAVLLVIVVLLQTGKGDGMASNFVAANQVLGVRQAANDLEKWTWYLVSFVLVLSVVSAFTVRNGAAGMDISQIDDVVTEQPAFPSTPADVPQEAPATETEAE